MAMENLAIVVNGVVENVVVAESGWAPPSGTAVAAGPGCVIGATYENGVFTPPSAPPAPAPTLDQAQSVQTALMTQAYAEAISQPVAYTTAAGVAKTYDADPASQNLITQAFTLYSAAGAVPDGFYWVAADNTQVPFTLADLKALGTAVGAQVWAAFQHLQTKKAAILDATTVAEVRAVTW